MPRHSFGASITDRGIGYRKIFRVNRQSEESILREDVQEDASCIHVGSRTECLRVVTVIAVVGIVQNQLSAISWSQHALDRRTIMEMDRVNATTSADVFDIGRNQEIWHVTDDLSHHGPDAVIDTACGLTILVVEERRTLALIIAIGIRDGVIIDVEVLGHTRRREKIDQSIYSCSAGDNKNHLDPYVDGAGQ